MACARGAYVTHGEVIQPQLRHTRPRRSVLVSASQQPPSDSSVKQEGKEGVLARIKRAREYKQDPTGAAAPAPAATAASAQAAAEDPLSQYARKQADAEAEQLREAQAAAAAASRPSTPLQAPGPRLPPPGTSLPAPTSLGQRIRRAKAYQAAQSADVPLPSQAPAESQPALPITAAQGDADAAAAGNAEGGADASDAEGETDRGFRRGGGNAQQAANWLNMVSSEGRAAKLDTNLRPEEFTQQLESLQRQRGATIERAKGKVEGTGRRRFAADDYGLAQQQDEAQASMASDRAVAAAAAAADAAADEAAGQVGGFSREAATGEQGEGVHNPAVATWGVFPRPKNISEAYGGGRNLRPGQRLESDDVEAARKERVSSALSSYRRNLGLDIEPEVEAQAQALYAEGEALFKAGAISAALLKFEASCALVPLRSRPGGLAGLQRAICLDSLGRNEEAYAVYALLQGHTAPGVAKTVKRMMFGFKAAKELKVDTMRFGTTSRAWQPWFERINSDAWAVYKAKEGEEEDEAAARAAAAAAAAVVLLPIALVGVLVLR